MGDPHEIANKKYFAKLIAEEIADVTLKVNTLSYDLWFYYELDATPYSYCNTTTLDIISDMGAPAQEVEIFEAGFPYALSWDPGNVGSKEITFDSGTVITLNKRIDKLYIHFLGTEGRMRIVTEGYEHWDC